MSKLNWEDIDTEKRFAVKRAKIPGGWLVWVSEAPPMTSPTAGGLTFIPDPKHEWDGNSLP